MKESNKNTKIKNTHHKRMKDLWKEFNAVMKGYEGWAQLEERAKPA